MFRKKAYKTPKFIKNLVLEYLVDADKGFLKSLNFLRKVKKVNRDLETLVSGGKIKKLAMRDTELREYFQLLGNILIAYTDAYIDSQRIGDRLENARDYAERFIEDEGKAFGLKYLVLVDGAMGNTGGNSVLLNAMVGNEIDKQPMYELGKYMYLLSHAILEYSDNADLKKDAKETLNYLTALQDKFDIFDFVVINGNKTAVDKYLTR